MFLLAPAHKWFGAVKSTGGFWTRCEYLWYLAHTYAVYRPRLYSLHCRPTRSLRPHI